MKATQYGPILSVVSDRELERRRHAAQKIMAEKDIDCILFCCFDDWQGGPFKYFTDYPVGCAYYGAYGIVPREGLVSLIVHGQEGRPGVNPAFCRGIDENIGLTYAPAFSYSNDYVPRAMADYINRHGYSRIGVYRDSTFPVHCKEYLKEHVKNCTFTCVNDEIDHLMAIKSDEELEIIKETVIKVHDELYAMLPTIIRPGRRTRDLSTDIKKAAMDMGCEGMNIMIGAGNPWAKHIPHLTQNEVIKEGDLLDLLIEVSGVGGYWGELSRMWSLGEPSKELIKINDDCIAFQTAIAEIAKPGVPAADLRRKMVELQTANGYMPEMRLFGHGQGLDLVQRPAYAFDETMVLEENMFVSIHPGIENDTMWSMVTDNYVITREGAVRLNQTESKLFVLD